MPLHDAADPHRTRRTPTATTTGRTPTATGLPNETAERLGSAGGHAHGEGSFWNGEVDIDFPRSETLISQIETFWDFPFFVIFILGFSQILFTL